MNTEQADSRTEQGVFRRRVEILVYEKLPPLGVIMRPYYWHRHPLEQAKIWRRSRSREEIQERIDKLRGDNMDLIADYLELAGPQHGDWGTDALPGYSWHQYDLAADSFWLVDGKAEWSIRKGGPKNGYKLYAAEAQKLGLTALGPLINKDWGHLQLYREGVAARWSYEEIEQRLLTRWGAPRKAGPPF